MRVPLLLAPAVLMAGPAAPAKDAPPFAYEDVDFAPDCSPNPAFDRLLGLLLPGPAEEDPVAVPDIDEPLFNATSGAVLHELQLDREVPWHGLRLIGVRYTHGVESGPSNLSLVFADGPEQVRKVWNARGWDLPPGDGTRLIDSEEILTGIGLEPAEGRVAVTCFRD